MSDKCSIKMKVTTENWPIDGSFTIARGSRTQASVVVVTLMSTDEVKHIGKGECVPYVRYGESVESVCRQLNDILPLVEQGLTKEQLQNKMPAGAARNALDCAYWDIEAKTSNISVSNKIGIKETKPLTTAYTISLDTPRNMAEQTDKHKDRDLLKIKLGGDGDHERMMAVRDAAPNAGLILDANEAWPESQLQNYLDIAANIKAVLVEQPLRADEDDKLKHIERSVVICADESVHTREGLEKLKSRYDCINIKLDKTGGLTEALKMFEEARALNFSIMVGCMVGTSLAMAPAVLLAQNADFVDLDGPLLLAKDRENRLTYPSSLVTPPSSSLWG